MVASFHTLFTCSSHDFHTHTPGSVSSKTGSVSSSDEAEYKPPKNKHKKVKKLNSTEQQPTAKKRMNVSKEKTLRKKSQKNLVEQNADLQSVAIGKELTLCLKMKVRQFSGNDSTEFELTVDHEMTLGDLQKKCLVLLGSQIQICG